MRSGRYVLGLLMGLGAWALGSGVVVRTQEPPSEPDKPADAAPPAPAKKTAPKTNKDNATESIDRFQDATLAKPGYAVPFRFLGEAQEKKGLKKPAIKSYQRYLELYPRAEDAEKIRKRIEKLYKDVEKEKKEIK